MIPPGQILLREGAWDGSPARQLVGERGKDRSSWEIKKQTTETYPSPGGQIQRQKVWVISLLCRYRNTTPERESPAPCGPGSVTE